MAIPKGKRSTPNSDGRKAFIEESIKAGCIPLKGPSGVYHTIGLFEKHESLGGSIDNHEDFPLNSGGGQKPILDHNEIATLNNTLNSNLGHSERLVEMENFCIQRTNEKNRLKGITTLLTSSSRPTQQTLKNYNNSCLSLQPTNHLVEKTTLKTPTRFTAENSISPELCCCWNSISSCHCDRKFS